ncbi:hypothetical protein E2K93_08585 [Thalassotalea sp. HSM 43]|uniref:hypothetical protein n=1 Tax=Thalassotalea sp. HSM 43 TaxID=2552945 RepID=UPI001080086F|nr:hypothetical protein [Thalassotalea sp. HSM 43]QBY04448.1 hypothetical protein E2K93_08585 [Thalassotalea sp. HSM 43]
MFGRNKLVKTLTITLLLVCSVCPSFASSSDNEEPGKAIEFAVGYVKQDLCWTTNVADCEVDGVGIAIIYPLDWGFIDYVIANAAIFESTEHSVPGETGTKNDLYKLGVGKKFSPIDDFTFFAEASFIVANDDENFYAWENTNYNDGYELGGVVAHQLNRKIKIGTGVKFQKYQNCSAIKCHGLKGKKPVIKNLEVNFYVRYMLSEKFSLGYRAFKVAKIFNESDYNGRDRGFSHIVAIHYRYQL